MALTSTEIEDLIKKAKCCAKPSFVPELPSTVTEGKFVIVNGELYAGHNEEWVSLGVIGEGVADTLAFWDDTNSLDSVSINTGITFSDGVINSSFRNKRVVYYAPTTLQASWEGQPGSYNGFNEIIAPTSDNIYTTTFRAAFNPASAVANLFFGPYASIPTYFRDLTVQGSGGFNFFARGGANIWTNGSRLFCGFSTSPPNVVTSNPSAFNNTVGFAVDDTDAGQIYFLTRDDTSATKIPTGFTISNNEGYDFEIHCEPNGDSYAWKITSLNNGAISSGVATLTLPIADTLLSPCFLGSNGAAASTSTIQIGVSRIYVESNY